MVGNPFGTSTPPGNLSLYIRVVCVGDHADTVVEQRSQRVLLCAGQIGYALCPQVARGGMLGHNQPIILHLLDIAPAQQSLEGVKMELIDAAFPLLKGKKPNQ